jgi:hypothetical protein
MISAARHSRSDAIYALKYAIFFCEFGLSFERKALTQVCVLNVVF